MEFLIEKFYTIQQLLDTIENRPNNKVMKNKHESASSDYEFTKTHSYEEAKSLLQYGYVEPLAEIKAKVKANIKNNFIYKQNFKNKNSPVGYVPNVPNALKGLPESMITKEKKEGKRKVITIYYFNVGNACRETSWFLKAGIALLSTIQLIEMAGIQVDLRLGFDGSEGSNQSVFGILKVKDFNERFNLQKICFPMAHPSMLRRIAFKWLETVPGLTDTRYQHGYGRSYSEINNEIKEAFGIDDKNVFGLFASEVHDMGCSVDELLKFFNITK